MEELGEMHQCVLQVHSWHLVNPSFRFCLAESLLVSVANHRRYVCQTYLTYLNILLHCVCTELRSTAKQSLCLVARRGKVLYLVCVVQLHSGSMTTNYI